MRVEKNRIVGKVDNDLVKTDSHGLYYGDSVEFTRDNIYAILKFTNHVRD